MQVGEVELFWCCEEDHNLMIFIDPPFEIGAMTELNREQARELGNALLHFAEHGTLPE